MNHKNQHKCLKLIILIIVPLTMTLLYSWGLYHLAKTYGLKTRFEETENLQKIHIESINVSSFYKENLKSESWINIPDEKQRALAALEWVMNRVTKVEFNENGRDPDALLKSVLNGRGGLCGEMSTLYQNTLAAVEIHSRRVVLRRNLFDEFDAHVTVEIFLNGKWVLIDPTFGISVLDQRGEAFSAQDIKNYLLAGKTDELSYMHHGNYRYPANINKYYINYEVLFNNVFVYNKQPNLLTAIPPWGYWKGAVAYYEKAIISSEQHIVFAKNLYFIFFVVIPCFIIMISLFCFFWLIER